VIGASLLASFLPETAKKIAAQMNTKLRSYEELDTFGLYESGACVTEKPEILFARLDLKEVMPKVEEIQAAQKAEYEAEQARIARVMGTAPVEATKEEKVEMEAQLVGEHKPEIEYADFDKCEFRVGEIVECAEVPKSKKLLCSQVKVGDKTVQILSGIKMQYSPEEMVGKKVMVLLNLKPVTMAGLQSEGMILCAEDAEGNLSLMTPEKDFHAGSEIC
jgi:methionyl-tRNA synthetase